LEKVNGRRYTSIVDERAGKCEGETVGLPTVSISADFVSGKVKDVLEESLEVVQL